MNAHCVMICIGNHDMTFRGTMQLLNDEVHKEKKTTMIRIVYNHKEFGCLLTSKQAQPIQTHCTALPPRQGKSIIIFNTITIGIQTVHAIHIHTHPLHPNRNKNEQYQSVARNIIL
eukprot:265045_1